MSGSGLIRLMNGARDWFRSNSSATIEEIVGIVKMQWPLNLKGDTSILDIDDRCTRCGICLKECLFLRKYGTPGELARNDLDGVEMDPLLPFYCSLCGLCEAVCPFRLKPQEMFLALRKKRVQAKAVSMKNYRSLLRYEAFGRSRWATLYAIPERCHTVFFPGCTLPGTRPDKTMKLFWTLQKSIPALGMVLDCCTKPSHDLGRQNRFETMFGEILAFLVANNIRTVITACPNCHKVFTVYGRGLNVISAYALIDPKAIAPIIGGDKRPVTIHDPCVLRFEPSIHEAVRKLIRACGFPIEEMAHFGERTLCCGEGGSVMGAAHALASNWGGMRKTEAQGMIMVTYCAGCAGMLDRYTPTVHLLDVLFDSPKETGGKNTVSRGLFTYWNRLRLKRHIQKDIPGMVTRDRPRVDENKMN